MTYRVEIRSAAREYIKKLPKPQQARVLDALAALSNDPHPPASKGSQMVRPNGGCALAIGALYDIYDDVLVVDIVRFDPRGQAYK